MPENSSRPDAPRSKPARASADDERRDGSPWMPDGSVVDRRTGIDRRAARADGQPSGLERRRGPGRRLSDFTKAAEEGEMTREQFLFLMAIDEFKRANAKGFPSWSDVLEVIRLLGYRKTMPSELNLDRAEDWREPPNAPSDVRPDRWSRRFDEDEWTALADLPDSDSDAEDEPRLGEAA